MNFQRAAAIDLAGRDVFEAVQVSVNPRVITTAKISALALDGVELMATVRITVRTNINRLVGVQVKKPSLHVSARGLSVQSVPLNL